MGPALGLFLSFTTERRLERALAEGQQRGGQLQEQLTQQLSQALSSAVAGRLERSIRDEIKKTVPPCEFFMRFLFGWAMWVWEAFKLLLVPSVFHRCLQKSGACGGSTKQLSGFQTYSCGRQHEREYL